MQLKALSGFNSKKNIMAEKITMNAGGKLNVPNNPIIPFIEGDGIGPEIWHVAQKVFDTAVEKAYNGERKIGGEVCEGMKTFLFLILFINGQFQ